MDWSLVLASQGIESAIAPPENERGWALLVAAEAHESALRSIRQYQFENRRWPWHQTVFHSSIFDWSCLAWGLLLAVFFQVTADGSCSLQNSSEMLRSAVSQGQWWRLFTAIWLHADAAHFAGNLTMGLVLLGLALGRYGSGAGLLMAYLAGAGGNLCVWLLSTRSNPSLGASGMVMGGLGLLAASSFPLLADPHGRKRVITGLFGGILLFVLLGMAPGTDVLAHLGGFLSGLLLGALAQPLTTPPQRPKTNLLCGLTFLVLVLWPWGLALRHGLPN